MGKRKYEPYVYKEGHTYYAVLTDNENNKFIGKARCCEEDFPFESDNIGYKIAHYRAAIKQAKYLKRTIKHELTGLKRFYYSINQSKKFNTSEYSVKMLYRQMKHREDEIAIIDYVIDDLGSDLESYIRNKEDYHNKIIKNREKKNIEQDENK